METWILPRVALWAGLAAGATAGACGGFVGDSGKHREVVASECVSCHDADVPATHPDIGLPHESCSDCHGQESWVPARWPDHGWPLEGAHATARCASCHVGDPPVYAGTPTACVACHQDDYDSSPFPGHGAFPVACENCHSTSGWVPSVGFDHPWPLTGAHATARCASCHAGDPPVYAGTPTACVDCHRADYDSSPYPDHNTFPTTCDGCHTTAAWKPATGGHPETKFPRSGPHGGIACADCHNANLGPNGAGNADCVGCHSGEHSRARMDDKHREAPGYPIGDAPPNFCLDCHPNGRNGG